MMRLFKRRRSRSANEPHVLDANSLAAFSHLSGTQQSVMAQSLINGSSDRTSLRRAS